MKPEALKVLCCPVCRSDLELRTDEEAEGDIIRGALLCKKCDLAYDVEKVQVDLMPKKK